TAAAVPRSPSWCGCPSCCGPPFLGGAERASSAVCFVVGDQGEHSLVTDGAAVTAAVALRRGGGCGALGRTDVQPRHGVSAVTAASVRAKGSDDALSGGAFRFAHDRPGAAQFGGVRAGGRVGLAFQAGAGFGGHAACLGRAVRALLSRALRMVVRHSAAVSPAASPAAWKAS